MRRPPRWSKRIDELVQTIAPGVRPGLRTELGHWLESSPRFQQFAAANQDKIRKKLATRDEDARQDVRAELVVAHALLADRRFELAFEAYGAGQVGPDFTVAYRTNQQFNVEVTRLRAVEHAVALTRLGNVVVAKLRQLPADRPNVLVVSAQGLGIGEDDLGAALRTLKARADARDDAFFARRGLKTARDFAAGYVRLSGAFVLDGASARFVANREARRPLAPEIVAASAACLALTPEVAETAPP